MGRFYLTTTLPYVNADPHIGFALEIIQADAIVRYRRLLGDEVFFNTGTDEHGLKIYRVALAQKKEPQAYCDEYAAKFRDLAALLNLDNPTFIRTTDAHHKQAAQVFWQRCLDSGDIYKKVYHVKYCVGCELEKTDSELENGHCPMHPKMEIEIIDEENYFFRFSKYQKPLLELYKKYPDFVMPPHRQNDIKAFVERGLEDFSISRLKKKMPWGVAVPNDPDHVMYVWFDALINYISTLGWPHDEKKFKEFWGIAKKPMAVQVAGKDNLRQQTAMWQAMLMSAGLPNSRQIFIHGFITADGQKMSKSLGNVVNPYDEVARYGVDAVRYYLLGGIPSNDDGDYSRARFEEYYTAHLANGIGNLTSRIITLIEKYSVGKIPAKAEDRFNVSKFWSAYDAAFAEYRFDDVVRLTQGFVTTLDETINQEKPWAKAKAGEDIDSVLYQLSEGLRHIATALLPVIPRSAEKILQRLGVGSMSNVRQELSTLKKEQKWGGLKKGGIIKKGEPLFPRLTMVIH